VTSTAPTASRRSNLGKLQSLIDVAKKDVVISAGWDITTFVQQAQNLTGGNVVFATLPIERYATVDGQAVNIVDQVKVRQQVRIAFGLQAPPPATTTAPPAAAPVTVNVLNGDGNPGLATTVSNALVGGGLTAGTVGNSTQHTTAVSYSSGAQGQAEAIAGLLGAPAATPDAALPTATVTIVLGKGFTPAADLAQQATTLKQKTPPPTAPPTAPPTSTAPPAPGPQGLPVDGGGVPCVD
jgi:hypothetical protein